ncbi:MAG: energy-coupling factor ABC transporter permease [Lachnospiraceae bacterium]
MHMADAFIAPAVAITMYTTSGIAAGISVKRVEYQEDAKKVPLMGVMGAFVFAAQMINFTIPGTGASGHLAGGILLAAVLGPYAGFLTLSCVLMIQSLLFADGGLLALGCNIWNLAFYGCILGGFLILRPIFSRGITKRRIIAASMIGSILTLQLGAFSVVAETTISGVSELTFLPFLSLMQPIHLAIGIVEGLITSAVLCFVHEMRPELIWGAKDSNFIGRTGDKVSVKQLLAILMSGAIVMAGFLSYFASAKPDGLEWSIQNTISNTETQISGLIYSISSKIQSVFSIFPDYTVGGSESVASGSLAGIFGALLVFAFCIFLLRVLKRFKRKRIHE